MKIIQKIYKSFKKMLPFSSYQRMKIKKGINEANKALEEAHCYLLLSSEKDVSGISEDRIILFGNYMDGIYLMIQAITKIAESAGERKEEALENYLQVISESITERWEKENK